MTRLSKERVIDCLKIMLIGIHDGLPKYTDDPSLRGVVMFNMRTIKQRLTDRTAFLISRDSMEDILFYLEHPHEQEEVRLNDCLLDP